MNSSGKKGEHKVKTAASFCGGGETKVESRRPRLVLAIWSWVVVLDETYELRSRAIF